MFVFAQTFRDYLPLLFLFLIASSKPGICIKIKDIYPPQTTAILPQQESIYFVRSGSDISFSTCYLTADVHFNVSLQDILTTSQEEASS